MSSCAKRKNDGVYNKGFFLMDSKSYNCKKTCFYLDGS